MGDRLTVPPAGVVPIIGGGPAGMSCALWLHNYGLRPVIIERETELGGMARRSPYPNEWLLGRPDETARENAAAFAGHIRKLAVEIRFGARPQLLRHERAGFRLALASSGQGHSLSAPVVVIATGTRFRGEDWLDRVPNARRLAAAGRVQLGPAAVGEPNADPGSEIAVIGGGDNAFDVSRVLIERGARVTLVMRSQAPRAQPMLVARVRAHEASGTAKVLAERTVVALDDAGSRIRVRMDDGGEIAVDRVVLLFGYRPNTDQGWLAELALKVDAHGFVVVDGNMETSCRGVFAVGDIASPKHPCIATAVATGTMAARRIQTLLARHPAQPPGL